jgi:GDPmannose 4,6-dehydratase
MENPKVALICGIHGQDGSYLARFLLGKGYSIFGTSRNANEPTSGNLKRLGISQFVTILMMNPEDIKSVRETLDICCPDEIYNLAGQSSVGLSFKKPRETVDSIVIATLNLLEACRLSSKKPRLYQAGSSECFGNTLGIPATEKTPFSPTSPYGVAKVSAFWLVDNYRNSYDLFACTGILFNHESPLRPQTFVTQKIITAANNIASGSSETLTLGQLDILRDWGWAPEYVEAMWLMLQQNHPEDFVIATGKTNSLEQFVSIAFASYGLRWQDYVVQSHEFYRPSDLQISNADPTLALEKLSWAATSDLETIIQNMLTDTI